MATGGVTLANRLKQLGKISIRLSTNIIFYAFFPGGYYHPFIQDDLNNIKMKVLKVRQKIELIKKFEKWQFDNRFFKIK